jgi:hypothetical protein
MHSNVAVPTARWSMSGLAVRARVPGAVWCEIGSREGARARTSMVEGAVSEMGAIVDAN